MGTVYEAHHSSLDPTTTLSTSKQPNSEIMAPVYTLPNPDGCTRPCSWMSEPEIFGASQRAAQGGNNVVEYPLTGYSSSGTPEYGSAVSYGMPPGLVDVRRVDVEGNAIYVSGFSAERHRQQLRYGATGNPSA